MDRDSFVNVFSENVRPGDHFMLNIIFAKELVAYLLLPLICHKVSTPYENKISKGT